MDIISDPSAPLYTAVGVVVISWAFVERAIDSCVSVIYHKYNGKTISNEIPATRLSEKIKFIKKSFKMPILHQYKDKGLSLLDRVNKLSKDRHQLIHGVVLELTSDSLEFTQLKYGKEIHEIKYFSYKINDLLDYGKKIQALSSDFVDFVHRLARDFANRELGL